MLIFNVGETYPGMDGFTEVDWRINIGHAQLQPYEDVSIAQAIIAGINVLTQEDKLGRKLVQPETYDEAANADKRMPLEVRLARYVWGGGEVPTVIYDNETKLVIRALRAADSHKSEHRLKSAKYREVARDIRSLKPHTSSQ